MAPKVKVPANFGKHHIGKPAHGNLIFKLKDGKEIRGNSMILSLNSPVIDHLTTNLDQQTLDVDDFQKDAIDCFIEAAYTGELENIDNSNFRDVNKMSHVFDVMWLRDKCAEYFKLLVNDLHAKEYEDILFVVEEARYIRTALKNREFLNSVVEKLGCMITKRDAFVDKYMVDFYTFPKEQLDVVMEIVGVDVHVLVQFVTTHLENSKGNLDGNTRYLLENLNLSLCYNGQFGSKCDALFSAIESLENFSKEDSLFFVKLIKQYVSGKPPAQLTASNSIKPKMISNVFYFYKQFSTLTFDDLINELAVSEDVKSLYMFFDAVWIWLYQHSGNSVSCDQPLLNKIINIKEAHKWNTMSYQYLEMIYTDSETKKFVDLIIDCPKLFSEVDSHYISSVQRYPSYKDFSQAIFLRETKITFTIHGSSCTRNKSLQFNLQTTPVTQLDHNEKDFDIQVCIEHDEDNHKNCDSELHSQFVNAKQLHIVLELYEDNSYKYVPLSWCGKPDCDTTEKLWRWGHFDFYGSVGLRWFTENGFKYYKLSGENYRFVIFY